VLALCVASPVGASSAEDPTQNPTTLTLDPAATQVEFEVDSTLHRVEGTAHLVSGVLHFDPAGGAASGAIEVDATSLETGNGWRDDKLHSNVLDSEHHPRIVFRPEQLVVVSRSGSEAEVRVEGTLELHGQSRPLSITATVRLTGPEAELDAHFPVPYLDWGCEDPSTFLLSVDKVVQVHVRTKGRLEPAPR
jgi:polyisoprenoid-binding protein YceI